MNEAKAKIPADLSVYTDDSVKDLKDVLAGIDENLPRSKQKEVDAYADAIEAAIGNLVLKQQNGAEQQEHRTTEHPVRQMVVLRTKRQQQETV